MAFCKTWALGGSIDGIVQYEHMENDPLRNTGKSGLHIYSYPDSHSRVCRGQTDQMHVSMHTLWLGISMLTMKQPK